MRALTALLIATLPPGVIASVPATAQEAPAADPAADPAAGQFIENLSRDAFAVLKDESLTETEARNRFRTMLEENVALRSIGQRLIRKHRRTITPAQLEAYDAALPNFILSTYSDRLSDYRDATVKVMRLNAHGPYVDVQTRVERPGSQPIDAIWQVRKTPQGRYLINNLTVSNINLTITQEADFDAYIQRNGFDALVTFLETANSKSAAAR